MDYPYIIEQLTEILIPISKGRIEINEDTELAGELALDSLQVMDVLLEVEDRFDISVPVNGLAEVKTVRDLAEQILKCANQTP